MSHSSLLLRSLVSAFCLVSLLVNCKVDETPEEGTAGTSGAAGAAGGEPEAGPTLDAAKESASPDVISKETGNDALQPTESGGDVALDTQPPGPLVPVPPRVGPSGEVTVQFSSGSTDPAAWIGLFASGAGDDTVLFKAATGGTVTGSVLLATPEEVGQYELRLFGDAGTTKKLGTAPLFVEMPYDLDPSFGGGKITFDSLGNQKADWVCGIRGLADGKVIVAGTAKTGEKDSSGWEKNEFVIARLLTDGTLDSTFGQGGRVHLGMTTHALAGCAGFDVQADGKYLLVGWGFQAGPGADFVLARFDAAGTPDSSFGTAGVVTTNLKTSATDPGQWDKAASVVALADGKIAVGGSLGYNGSGTFSSVALARYLSTGAPDTSFGSAGTLVLEKKSWLETARSLAADADSTLFAGISDDGSYASNTTSIARITPSGALDPAFGDKGIVVEKGPTGPDERRLIQILHTSTGSILLLGQMQGSWFLGSYSSLTGAAEGPGLSTVTFGSAGARAGAMATTADGKVLVGLSPDAFDGTNSVDGNFGLARHNANGALDLTFGRLRWKWNQGTTVIGSRVTAMAVQADGKVLLAGFIDRGGGAFDFDFAISRLVKNPAW